jgi:hypothetical protein
MIKTLIEKGKSKPVIKYIRSSGPFVKVIQISWTWGKKLISVFFFLSSWDGVVNDDGDGAVG